MDVLSLLPEMIVLADEVSIYDNSYEKTDPTLLFQKLIKSEDNSEPEMIVWLVDDEEVAEWVNEHVLNPLDDMGIPVQCYKRI